MSRVETRQRLVAHPDFPCAAIHSVEVAVTMEPQRLILHYVVAGHMDELDLPVVVASDRADGLWQGSCLEAFLQLEYGYAELNFSPSTQWAAYRFDGYRQGMRDLDMTAPRVTVEVTELRWLQTCIIDVPEGVSRMGLSAIFRAKDGSKSYWALAHPAGEPDFHNPDCFALDLSAWDRA